MRDFLKLINILVIIICLVLVFLILSYLPDHIERFTVEPEDVYLDGAYLLLLSLALTSSGSMIWQKLDRFSFGLNALFFCLILIPSFTVFMNGGAWFFIPFLIIAFANAWHARKAKSQ